MEPNFILFYFFFEGKGTQTLVARPLSSIVPRVQNEIPDSRAKRVWSPTVDEITPNQTKPDWHFRSGKKEKRKTSLH